MTVNPMIKKAICQLWGHSYVLTPSTTEFVPGGQESICRRCGKEHFRSYANEAFPDLPLNSARESMVNFSGMQRHSRDTEIRQ